MGDDLHNTCRECKHGNEYVCVVTEITARARFWVDDDFEPFKGSRDKGPDELEYLSELRPSEPFHFECENGHTITDEQGRPIQSLEQLQEYHETAIRIWNEAYDTFADIVWEQWRSAGKPDRLSDRFIRTAVAAMPDEVSGIVKGNVRGWAEYTVDGSMCHDHKDCPCPRRCGMTE